MMTTYKCPVCGFADLHDPARDSQDLPSFDICSSCGFEFGVTDDDQGYTYEGWRKRWVDSGMLWWSEGIEARPEGWDPRAQLASLHE